MQTEHSRLQVGPQRKWVDAEEDGRFINREKRKQTSPLPPLLVVTLSSDVHGPVNAAIFTAFAGPVNRWRFLEDLIALIKII